MTTQFLTCKFKIHKPSGHKRQVMDHALTEYTLAYGDLLVWAQEHEELLWQEGRYQPRGDSPARYTGMSVGQILPRPSTLKCEIHSSAQDSLIKDVAGNLASYLALKEEDGATSFPVGRDPDPEAVDGVLDDFAGVLDSIEDYIYYKARLEQVTRGTVMPLYFCRADGASQNRNGAARNRNFSLLGDSETERLLAVLYLLPKGHELGKPLGATQGNLYRLDTGEVFQSNSRSAILVPLELGKNGWQRSKFMEAAQAGQAAVQSAFLVREDRHGEYYLHVSFALDCPEIYRPQAYLGLDKGLLFTAAFGVVDEQGRVLENGHLDDELRALQIKHGRERERLSRDGRRVTWWHYKRQAYENILHTLVNSLIEKALAYRGQIVIEDMALQVKGGRVVSRFRKLDRYLTYKCRLNGVPFRSVFAAYSSMICHKCGETMERHDRRVCCLGCRWEGHSDDNAAVNIARRALYRKAEWEKRGGYRAFHRSFAKGPG